MPDAGDALASTVAFVPPVPEHLTHVICIVSDLPEPAFRDVAQSLAAPRVAGIWDFFARPGN